MWSNVRVSGLTSHPWTRIQINHICEYEHICIYIWIYIYIGTRFRSRWRHQMETFFALLAICAGIHRWSVNSPHIGQWRRALMFSLICARINGWVNNGEAGDFRRHRAHYDITLMFTLFCFGYINHYSGFIKYIYPCSSRLLRWHWGNQTIALRTSEVTLKDIDKTNPTKSVNRLHNHWYLLFDGLVHWNGMLPYVK